MNSTTRIYLQLIQQVSRLKMLGRKTTKKSGQVVIGMAPELRLPKYEIPKDLRKVLENDKKQFPEMTNKHEKYLLALEDVIKKKELTAETYVLHLQLLLYMEEYERELDMKMYDLNNQKIKKASGREFCIHVPGLAEERPSLQLYDEVQVRQKDGTAICTSAICYIGQRFVKVVTTDKFSKKYDEDHLYNIRFLLPRRTIQCCQHALSLIQSNQLVPALFPEVRTCYNKLSKELCWFDNNIATNTEQKQAISNIVARTAHPAPYILFGPPGTGKTATLVEAISQIWKNSPSSHVLICTPSNAAADEILKRLLKNIPQQDIHRMYGPSRNWDDVDEQIKPCSNFIDGEIIFLPRELIMLRRIVVVTLMSCARLLPLKLRENHFSYVFIDEAGQATEPETLIPLGLMSSSDPSHKGRFQGQLVIAGDPKQLGPSITVKCVNTLGISMLERLMNQCGPYQKDHFGRYNQMYITKLIKNFRSHQSILSIPNKLFYENELLACGNDSDINRAVNYSGLPKKSFPLIFHGVAGQESRESNSPSMYNMDEIMVIIKYLKELIGTRIGGRKLEQKDVGIVTPYKLQRMKIHKILEENNWNDVSVGTVETFQGQERDVIIISTVRSTICKHNGREHLGFLSNPKRFNVAVTRAKSLLITVGNPNILQSDDCWKELRNYCIENNAYIGTKVSHNLTRRQKERLIAKKYVPKPVPAQDFEFPEEILASPKFENCKLFENLVPRRRARLPDVTKIPASLPQLEFDSGVTSTSNSSSSTNSEPQDRGNLWSNSSPSIDEDSDESSLLTVDGFIENDLDDLEEPSSDCSDSLDFETPPSLSENEDDDGLSTGLKKVTLSPVNPNKDNSGNND